MGFSLSGNGLIRLACLSESSGPADRFYEWDDRFFSGAWVPPARLKTVTTKFRRDTGRADEGWCGLNIKFL